MILELDIGNTRIKWRLLGGGPGPATGSVDSIASLATLFDTGCPLARVRVASVAGPDVAADLDQWVNQRWRIMPEYARVSRLAAGVTCGYQDPSCLGVDRWLAVLAAWHEKNEPLLVVDAGSAITLDIVNPQGRHEGGYIVPGLALMHRVLAVGTVGARVDSGFSGDMCPGQSTDAAVQNGCLAMAVAFIESTLNRLGADYLLFLTGGDAPLLESRLQVANRVLIRPELVLDGLPLILP